MINQAFITAGSVFIATAVVFPLDRRYRAWKASRPEVILRRNWRGKLVPDLRIKRIERAVLIAIGLLFLAGLAIDWTIMNPPANQPPPPLYPPRTSETVQSAG